MISFAAFSNIAAASFFFMLANLAMKQLAGMHWLVLYLAVGLSAVAGIWFEVRALKLAQLGHTVAILLSFEIILSILVAAYFLRESYGVWDGIGFVFIILGVLSLGGNLSGLQDVEDREESGREKSNGRQAASNASRFIRNPLAGSTAKTGRLR